MPRVSILDSILNRPSQTYTPEPEVSSSQRRNGPSTKWAPPPDLPNANGAPSSILSGNMFRRKTSRNFSGMSSDAGMSAAPSTSSRFGRKKRSTSRDYGSQMGSQYAPSSIADSNTTTRKSRWWETGSMTFGRRSRAPSMAGDSVFSEPERNGTANGWPSMTGVGTSTVQPRGTRSDYGGSRGNQSNTIPPVPKLDSRYVNAAQAGRLQSNVAPLGSTSLNPTLNKRPSKSRISSGSQGNLSGSYNRAASPPPAIRDGRYTPRMSSPPPGSGRVSSPPPRPLSPAFSDSGRSVTNLQAGAEDWKNFVKSMSGSEVSKVWESNGNVSNIGAALNNSKAVNGVERRKSNVIRLQKELEQDSQYEQVVRDPGVIHQDLLARAASQVVGTVPSKYEDADLLGAQQIRPGSIVSGSLVAERTMSPAPPAPLPQTQWQDPLENEEANGIAVHVQRPSPRAASSELSPPGKVSSGNLDESEEEVDSDDESSDSEESEKGRNLLEVVNEEEEDSSSVGHEMRPHYSTTMAGLAGVGAGAALTSSTKYKGFEAAIKRSSLIGHGSSNGSAGASAIAAPSVSVNGHAASSSQQSYSPPDSTLQSPIGESSDEVQLPSIPTLEANNQPEVPPKEDLPKLPAEHRLPDDSFAPRDNTDDEDEEEEEDVEEEEKAAQSKTVEANADTSHDDTDGQSIHSTQTGKATVKFDQDAKEDGHSISSDGTVSRPKSLSGSVRSGSRPPTLSRRLSDLSLGTSFGMSGIIRDSSRSSTRVKLADGDSDSVRSLSDEEGDSELKDKIKAEQERLRSMKVGEDFFGGSLSSILDKFGASSFEKELSNVVGELDLDVGSSSKASKRESGPLSTQEILSMNAQERINEVRRLRSESTSASIRGGKKDNSDTVTVQSGIAPSFAAIWLLNQSDSATPAASTSAPSQSKETTPTRSTKGHSRQQSSTSSEGNSSTATRLKNFFNPPSSVEPLERKHQVTSVMDRPRNRKPKPKQMGGVAISQGKLTADKKGEPVEDTRSTLPALVTSQTLSQMKEAKEKAEKAEQAAKAEKDPVTSLPSPTSPLAKQIDQPSSKDKPAPKKSALKPKKSKSLADTLFSFATASPEKKARNEEKKIQTSERKAQKSAAIKQTSVATSEAQQEKESKGAQTPTGRNRSGSDSVYMTPDKETYPYSQLDSPEGLPSFQTAMDLGDARSQSKPGEMALYSFALNQLQGPTQDATSPYSDEEEETWMPAVDDQPQLPGGDQGGDQPPSPGGVVTEDIADSKQEEHTPSSEIWSGESVASTGLTTPGASEFLDKLSPPSIAALTLPPLATRRSDSPKDLLTSPEKKLPMPPKPDFADNVTTPSIEGESTPLAVTRADPIHVDQNKTPMAEVREPSFGMNLIPPTPPALETRSSYTSLSSQKLKGVTPDTVMEQSEEEDDDDNSPVPIQRSNSKAKSSSSDGTRKSSKKKNTPPTFLHEYKGQYINLPPGLIATTVASSASRRHSSDVSNRPSTSLSEPSTDGTIKKKKSVKSKKSTTTPSRVYSEPSTSEYASSDNNSDMSHHRSSSVLRDSLATAPPVPNMPTSSSNLAIPSSRSETNSSNGSDSVSPSYSGSASPSPAPSASGRSAISSSNASVSAASELSNVRTYPRKIRTLSAGPNGQARTSLMSAISEWESSPPNVGREGAMSPMPSYIDSSISDSLNTRSQSSLHSGGNSPINVRTASIGGSAETYMDPHQVRARTLSRQSESLDGHGLKPWRGSYLGSESDISGLDRPQSSLGLPLVPSAPQTLTGYHPPHDPHIASNAIDDRLYAKTTMTTIAVTSGAFRSKSLRKRRSSADVSNIHLGDSAKSSRVSVDTMPEGLVEELQRTTMSLTAHTPPPRKLTSTQVLVQVITCAIDETDRQLLREKIRTENAYGFVPGRSFCGRIMETGWEVKRMRKGDMVFGLQSSRKCGALAEFMTVDQDLIAKAPEDCLTTEEIAALPAVGVMAYQMMTNHCSQLKRGSRILILNAHDGVGLLTMQEAANLGLIIVAQCPTNISDGVALCEANGAHEVVIGEPLWALNSLHESSFDLVLDTVGGRRVYDAARRILAFEGQFCTSVGDMQSTVNPNLKSHFRSLRRSFFKKDTKKIGYEWLSIDVGEDCREALEAVRLAAEKGLICPRLQSILSFAEAPRAFEVTLRGGQTEPGSIVVKVS